MRDNKENHDKVLFHDKKLLKGDRLGCNTPAFIENVKRFCSSRFKSG